MTTEEIDLSVKGLDAGLGVRQDGGAWGFQYRLQHHHGDRLTVLPGRGSYLGSYPSREQAISAGLERLQQAATPRGRVLLTDKQMVALGRLKTRGAALLRSIEVRLPLRIGGLFDHHFSRMRLTEIRRDGAVRADFVQTGSLEHYSIWLSVAEFEQQIRRKIAGSDLDRVSFVVAGGQIEALRRDAGNMLRWEPCEILAVTGYGMRVRFSDNAELPRPSNSIRAITQATECLTESQEPA